MMRTLHHLSTLALLSLASKSEAHKSFEHHLRSLAVEKIDCQIASVAIDYYGDKPPDHDMRCTRLNSEECFDIEFDPKAHPGRGKPHYPTGTIVTFRGSPGSVNPGRCRKLLVTGVDRVDLPEGFSPRNGGRALQHAAKTGIRSAMMMIVRFTDAQGTLVGTLANNSSRKSYAQTAAYKLFGTKNGTHTVAADATHADMWSECSYGKLSLARNKDNVLSPGFSSDFPGDANDVFYVDVPLQCTAGSGLCTDTYNLTAACGPDEYYGFPKYAFAYLTANVPGFTKSTWQHWVVIFDSSSNACNFVGMGNTDCTGSYCYAWIPHDYAHQAQDYVHELGHNINLAHSGFDSSTGKTGNDLEYGDMSGAMGYCCAVRCYNAPHAYELGWLQPSLELNDSNLTPGKVLQNVVLNSMSSSATGAVTLTGSWSGGKKFWLQYRTAHTFDKYMGSAWRNNVQIKVWSGSNVYEKTGDLNVKLIAGQSWSFGGVTVTVQSLNPSQTTPNAVLTIQRSCSTNANCDDGNFCNGVETCSAGICVAGQSPCGGAQPICDETNNICVQCLTNAQCSDSNFCNGVETCANGACTAGSGDPCSGASPAVCNEATDSCDVVQCTNNAHCIDDGLFCNGAPTCINNSCVINVPCSGAGPTVCNEATDSCDVVQCTTDAHCVDDDLFCNGVPTCINNSCVSQSPCGVGQCDEANNICVQCLTNAECSDGIFCNGVETCANGVCTVGTGDPCSGASPAICNEATDTCDVVQCSNNAHCVDDGLFCTGVPTCVNNSCVAGPSPCGGAQPQCDEINNICVQCLTDAECSDGIFCNGVETCANGICTAGTGDPCSGPGPAICNEATDKCDVVQCTTNAHCIDDGLFCTGAPTCINNNCVAGPSPCGGIQPQCDEIKNICVQCLTNAQCSDGIFCNGVETCAAGSCQSPGNPCTGSSFCNEGTDTCNACLGWKAPCSSGTQCCSRSCAGSKCTKP